MNVQHYVTLTEDVGDEGVVEVLLDDGHYLLKRWWYLHHLDYLSFQLRPTQDTIAVALPPQSAEIVKNLNHQM